MYNLGMFYRIFFFICIIVSGLCFFNSTFAAEKETPVSTEGIENLDKNIDKSQPDNEIKNEQKALQNRSKKYSKYKKELNKQNKKRDKAQKELEYLEKRLESKKQRVDSLSEESKGE
jgi:peptidoglycan hydrolase CwlO-like protein